MYQQISLTTIVSSQQRIDTSWSDITCFTRTMYILYRDTNNIYKRFFILSMFLSDQNFYLKDFPGSHYHSYHSHLDLDISVLPRNVDLRIRKTVEHTRRVHFPHLGAVSPNPVQIMDTNTILTVVKFNSVYFWMVTIHESVNFVIV